MKVGFSFIEIIVGLALSSVLGSVLFQSFYQSSRVAQFIDVRSEVDMQSSIILHQLEQDLASAQLPISYGYKGEEKKDKGEQKKAEIDKVFMAQSKGNNLESITFITTNARLKFALPQPKGILKPLLVRVTYRLQENKEEKGLFILTRHESSDLVAEQDKGKKQARAIELSSKVKSFNAECIFFKQEKEGAEKTIEKATTWDSDKNLHDEKHSTPPLPFWVAVKVVLVDQTKHEQTLEYAMPVYGAEDARIRQTAPKKQKTALDEMPATTSVVEGLAKSGLLPKPSETLRPTPLSEKAKQQFLGTKPGARPSFIDFLKGTP